MLKIFLVEDEYVIREGIRSLNWASHGYEFCGEAPDGEMALPLIRKSHPDIVITDIKMPFMDGLELSALDRFQSYAHALAEGSFRGWNPLDAFSILSALTAEDAAAFLCESLAPERLALSVIRPAE